MAEAVQLGKRKRKGLAYTLVSAAVTVAVFSVLLSFVSVGEIITLLENAELTGVVLFMCLSVLMSFCRAWRYKILLRLSGYSPHIVTVYLVVLLGNCFSDLLPARIGSLIYVFVFTQRLGVPFAAAMSSFAVAFLFDTLTVGPLAAIIVWGLSSESGLPRLGIAIGGIAVAAVTLLFLRYLAESFSAFGGIAKRLPLVPPGLREKIVSHLAGAEAEIRRTRSAGLYTQLFVLSVIIKVIKYGAQYMFLYALLAPRGYALENLSVFRVFAGICAAEVSASMPFAGIGGYGIYEGAWAFVLTVLGFPRDIAMLTAIPFHLFVQVWGYVLGCAALAILMLPVFKAESMRRPERYPPESTTRFFVRASLAVLLFVAAFFVLGATDPAPRASI